ncbi:MAG: helix-turn-helix domain-containing protein, partial [Burkholderiaceae bacterium]
LPVTTPPLRERPEDIAALCEHFAKVHANPNKLPVELSERLMEELLSYPWPGNIRELSNLMARFSALFPGKSICYTDIPTMMLPKGLRDRLAGDPAGTTVTVKLPEPSPVQATSESGNSNIPVADTFAATDLADVGDAPSALPETPLGPADYNPIEDLIALAQGTPLPAIDSIPLKQRIAELEKTLIEQALQQAEGNVSQTARILAIQRTTLIEKINKYNLKAQADEPSTA